MPRKKKNEKWIQEAIERPNRVRTYLKRTYGDVAFNKDGTIKIEYLNKAIERAKENGNTSLVKALQLAKTLKKIKK